MSQLDASCPAQEAVVFDFLASEHAAEHQHLIDQNASPLGRD